MKLSKNIELKLLRIGETNVMHNGEKATIIEYRSAMDIDVQFEDGNIVKHRPYYNFKNGSIGNPKPYCIRTIRELRIGETNIMKNGMDATIIKYRGAADIDVQFEDGAIAKHKAYSSFKEGKIAYPNFDKLLLKLDSDNFESIYGRYSVLRDEHYNAEYFALSDYVLNYYKKNEEETSYSEYEDR